ncbi:LysR family transcriptional regulator [Alkalimarinus coralli]|uniref:LysR family transcriptional regulator n=1 Tax=Alkalimarinus coralli TaxID=2935863 RepID=UPI00202B4FFB|nr:LysR family transcriptional regulator [Alkalimarinus coralli]
MSKLDNLNWDDLKYLVAVARSHSMTKAAAILKVNHSTVFRKVSGLEDALGAKLFVRQSGSYHLSGIGEEVLTHVERMVSHVADIERLIDNQKSSLQGQINLTVPHNFGYRFLPKYIAEFQQIHREVVVNLQVSNQSSNLSRQEADLAIRACSSPPEDVVGKHLFTLPWAAYASEQYIQSFGQPEGVADLNAHKLIGCHTDLTSLPAFKWLHANTPTSNIAASGNDLVSMSALAEAGAGIAILPADQAKPALKVLFTLEQVPPSEIWLLFHPDMRNCKRLKAFKSYLIDRLFKEPTLAAYRHT